MTTADYATLPEAFADLAPLAARWSRPTENERNALRFAARAPDFAAFHDAMAPRLDALLAYLAQCPAEPVETPQRNALMLACAYAEAAPHHELYAGNSEVPFSFDARRFVPDHGDETL